MEVSFLGQQRARVHKDPQCNSGAEQIQVPSLAPSCQCGQGSVNQGKLKVVKQEMTRVKINILGNSELKWTGMGEFNSDDHYIYYCGQEFPRRNGVALIVNKRV